MDSKYQSIFNNFAIIFRDRNRYIREQLKDCDSLQKGQFGVLFKVVMFPGITQKEISKKLNINKATTTRAIQKLKDSGMVIIKKDPSDSRNHLVHPTEKGQLYKKEIEKISNNWTEKILSSISEKEIDSLSETIKKISSNICEDL